MKRYVIAFGAMILLLGGLFFFNIGSGSVKMTGSEIADILLHRFGSTADETARQIVWEIRLPRICAAVILGGALSVAGFLLQSFFQNPIAGPYVLGISSGAKLVVALTMITLLEMGRTISSLHDCGGVCRIDACDGVRALNFLPGKKNVHACGMRHYDRLYLFGNHGFLRDVCG